MVNDPLGDMLTQIKNAIAVGKDTVEVPYSKFKHAVADALVEEGYLKSAIKKGKKTDKRLVIEPTYNDSGDPLLQEIERVSKTSRRLYTKASEIESVLNGRGRVILTTPKGVMSGQVAKEEKVGGEVLFKIW